MMMTNLSEFLVLIGKPRLNQIHHATYYGHTFRCACGFAHIFDNNTNVLCEGYLRLILACPVNPQYLTNVRTRLYCIELCGGLEGAFGTQLESIDDQAAVDSLITSLKI